MATKKPAIKIEPDQLQKLLDSIRQTWQAIGYDVIQGCEDCGERLTNAAALECALDANRMVMYGGKNGKEMDKFVSELFDKHGFSQVNRYLLTKVRLA